MFRHLFTIIWNKRKSNFMLILQIFLSFLVVFILATLGTELLLNYKKPLGFNYENIWVLSLNWPANVDDETGVLSYTFTPEQIRETVLQIKYKLQSYEELESPLASSHYQVPFENYIPWREVKLGDLDITPEALQVDDNYAALFGIEILEGRWFRPGDNGVANKPVVINQSMKEKYFPNENPIGKKLDIQYYSDKSEIIGVIGDYRHRGNFSREKPLMFLRFNLESPHEDENLPLNDFIFKVKEGTGAQFEAKLWNDVQNLTKGSWSPYISYLEDNRERNIKNNVIPIIILSIIGGFLILNTMLGLFGVLWYNISRRYAEIGLRRAVGANRPKIQKQFIGEMAMAASFALILGCLFAIQFPLLEVFDVPLIAYGLGSLGAVVLIYLLIVLCSFYPSKIASEIQPATALHEE